MEHDPSGSASIPIVSLGAEAGWAHDILLGGLDPSPAIHPLPGPYLAIHVDRLRLTVWAATFVIASGRPIAHPGPAIATPKPELCANFVLKDAPALTM